MVRSPFNSSLLDPAGYGYRRSHCFQPAAAYYRQDISGGGRREKKGHCRITIAKVKDIQG
jgi:hypothetical protein